MIFYGIPNLQIQCSKNKSAVYSAVIVVLHGIKRTSLENLSTMVKIASYPRALVGSCIMKSIVTCIKGCDGFSTGSSIPIGR